MAHNYTSEERAFIEQNYLGVTTIELTNMINAHFGANFNRGQIKAYLSKHNLSNGVVCRFKKGHIPVNHKPIGSERIDSKDGYHLIKVAEPNVWKAKHIVLWEKHNGPVPAGHKVVFANQNKDDIRIDNLLLVTNAQMAVVNRWRLVHSDRDLTKAGFTLANLLIGISKKSKKRRKNV